MPIHMESAKSYFKFFSTNGKGTISQMIWFNLLESMKLDLVKSDYNSQEEEEYIYGSADVG
jgi:hypothetical protein